MHSKNYFLKHQKIKILRHTLKYYVSQNNYKQHQIQTTTREKILAIHISENCQIIQTREEFVHVN